MRKKIILFVIAGITAMIVALTQLSLVKVADRGLSCQLSRHLKDEIKSDAAGMSAEEIRAYSIKKTAKQLSFTTKNDIAKGEANCVGYAQLCAAIGNYAFKVNNIKALAKPVVGYVMLCDVNICNVVKWCMPSERWENFVKDHDFVEFHIDGETIYCDACAYDLLWTDCKTYN